MPNIKSLIRAFSSYFYSDTSKKTFQETKSSSGLQKERIERDLDLFSGRESPQENPDTLLEDLGENLDFYDKMLNDDRIKLCAEIKKRLILAVPFSIVPPTEDQKDIEIAEEISNQLAVHGESTYPHEYGYSFTSVLDNALDGMFYGYKVAEKVFKIFEDKLYIHNIKFKHSEYFDFDYDDHGNLDKLLIGKDYGKDTEITPIKKINEKFLLFIYPYPKDGNFYGDSDLKELYFQFRSKDHVSKARNVHLEKWGSPIPEIIYDKRTVTPQEKLNMQEILDNFQSTQYILQPGQRDEKGELQGKFKVVIHEAKNASDTQIYEKTTDQIEKAMARRLLFPDKLGFSESPGGSYNMAEIQDKNWMSVITFMHGWLEGPINQHLIKQLVDLNFAGVEKYPKFKFDKINEKIAGDLLNILIGSGVVDPSEQWIRPYVGIPQLSPEEKEKIEADKPKEEPPKKPDNEAPKKEPDDDNGVDEPDDEKGMKVDLQTTKNPFDAKGTKKYFDRETVNFENQYEAISADMNNSIVTQIEKKVLPDRNIKNMVKVVAPKKDMRLFLTNEFLGSYFNGKVDAVDETTPRLEGRGIQLKNSQYECKPDNYIALKKLVAKDFGYEIKKEELGIKKFQVETEWLDKKFIDRFLEGHGDLATFTIADKEAVKYIRDMGFFISGIEDQKRLKSALFIVDNGFRTGMSSADIAAKVRQELTRLTQAHSETIARTNLSNWYNTGRMNFFSEPEMQKIIQAYHYQAIIDTRTTPFCNEHDGQVIKAGDPQIASITPPNHHGCRSALVPIFIGDNEAGYFKNWDTDFNRFPKFGTDISQKAATPAVGFGG